VIYKPSVLNPPASWLEV